MATNKLLSKTMRIDLIPEVPPEPVGPKERVVITTPGRLRRKGFGVPERGDVSQFHALLQSIYDAALICGADGRILEGNIRAVEFFLYPREELIGLSICNIISGADESLLETVKQNLENERFTLIQAYCVRKNQTYFPAEIAVNRLMTREMRLCFMVRDITVRRQAEEMLRTEHNAIQNATSGIAVTDVEARLEYVNPAVVRLWGYTKAEDIVGKDLRTLLADTDAASAMIGSVMSTGQPRSGEMKAVRADGSEFDVQISAARNRNSDGETVGMVLSLVDITDRKKAEAAMKEAERQRVMLESLGAACHHLGQPATVLLGNLDLLASRISTEDPQIRELLESSVQAVQSLSQILHKLNAVTQYRTTPYIQSLDAEAGGRRILDI